MSDKFLIIRSEFRKIYSVKANYLYFILPIVFMALSAYAAATVTLGINEDHSIAANVKIPLIAELVGQIPSSGAPLGYFVIAVFSATLFTNEYSNKIIINTYLAEPRRYNILVCKTALATIISVISGLLSSWASLLASLSLLKETSLDYSSVEENYASYIISTCIVFFLVSLLSISIGMICRSSTLTVLILALVLFVLPSVISLVSKDEDKKFVESYTPSKLTDTILNPPFEFSKYTFSGPSSSEAMSSIAATSVLLVTAIVVFSVGLLYNLKTPVRTK